MIKIKKSETADTRTCDFTKVSKDTLIESSHQHIRDVMSAMEFFAEKVDISAAVHDWTKITNMDQFHSDFTTGFETHVWYDEHKKSERHHLDSPDGIRDDVNIVDLLEHICDCVMAGKARSGTVRPVQLSDELLQKIVKNTVDLLASQVKVVEEVCPECGGVRVPCEYCGNSGWAE